jgi:hypothetical protein
MIIGTVIMAVGLLFWLSDSKQLQGVLKPLHVLLAVSIVPATVVARTVAEGAGWGVSAVQVATLNTTATLLWLLGEPVTSDAGQSLIGIGSFEVEVGSPCSGVAGMVMVSAVTAGYILASRERLKIGRALTLLPLAAGLSWVLNAVRIAVLLQIGAHVSPELAVNGFHTNAGWLAFCTLSAVMLLIAENLSWIHRRTSSVAAAPAMPILTDPTVAQIAPFVVLLLSSLLAGLLFVQPEAGYPARFLLMTGALLLFWNRYRAEIGPVDAIPVLGGALVALVWLGVNAGGPPLTPADILGPQSQGAVILWSLSRVLGTVLIVPFIEEMFFRGYLLRRLDFGGALGKIMALSASSALFGALHSNFLLAAASGLLFGVVALRRNRIFDAVVAHAAANGAIAAWAISTGDWSVI